MGAILHTLRADPRTADWMANLDALDEPSLDISLPLLAELPHALRHLGVPEAAIPEVVTTAYSTIAGSSDVQDLVRRTTWSIVSSMGTVDNLPAFPTWPASTGPLGRFFPIYVFVAAAPHVRSYHRARGIPDDVSSATLEDIGRAIQVHRRERGSLGIANAWWLVRHFRGTLYQLGRLQFERARLGARTAAAIGAVDETIHPGDPTLSVHIPGISGPFTPALCDASFAQARSFFVRHFPEEHYETAVCHSWLMDEQLPEYLPETSNIVRFQRRFHLAYQDEDNDASILRFIFGRTLADLDDLPRRTTLERAILDHLAAGRHWHGGAGWLRLQPGVPRTP